jgi:hypothetical protein
MADRAGDDSQEAVAALRPQAGDLTREMAGSCFNLCKKDAPGPSTGQDRPVPHDAHGQPKAPLPERQALRPR